MSEVRINLGSGHRPLPGFVNVDALPDAPGVDVVADIGERLPFDDGAADLVYASHVLEHFPEASTLPLLREWRRVLRPGGRLLVAVPDLEVIARHIAVSRPGWFTPPNAPWTGIVYGGQKDSYDFHKAGFTGPYLAWLLGEAGFGAVRRVERFGEIGIDDASWSPAPFGTNVSLNLVAVAGATGLPPALVAPGRLERAFDPIDRALGRAMRASTGLRARLAARRLRRIARELEPGAERRPA